MNTILFSVSKISFIFLTTPIDSANDENTMRRVILGYIYTLTIKIPIKEKTWNCLIFIVILETFTKFVETWIY